jgi:hypothetical protein
MILRFCFSCFALIFSLIPPKSSLAVLLLLVPTLSTVYRTFPAIQEKFGSHQQIHNHHYHSFHSYKRSITRKALLAACLSAL